ncbi:MAG: MBL fold metallo-hydrolase [Mogibacterium sp.]|nr:MBL fold metallo-hydrolase [Mogibacterium sp.]
MQILRYGNTSTYFLKGTNGGLLIDTDYAGTLPLFYKAIKAAGISVRDISYVIATHYHPDHMGIIGDLQRQGVTLVIVDVQQGHLHFSDGIFTRDKHLTHTPVDEDKAIRISCSDSREFLASIGISGEIIHIPSHSADSIAIILDNGDCYVGDLEPLEYLAAYESNPELQRDWDLILSYEPMHIYYAHVNDKCM